MSHTRSSGLLHQVRTLFGSGVVAGLSDGYVYDGSAVATVLSRLLTVLGFLPESLSEADRQARAPFIVSLLGHETFHQLRVLAGTIRAGFAVTLAALCGVFLVVVRRRFAEPPTRWPSAIRMGILAFFAVLSAFCAVDAGLIGFRRRRDPRAHRPRLPRLVPRQVDPESACSASASASRSSWSSTTRSAAVMSR